MHIPETQLIDFERPMFLSVFFAFFLIDNK